MLAAAGATVAGAEPGPERPVHWGLGAGGAFAATGADRLGGLAAAELYPGGRLDRYGARLEARHFSGWTAIAGGVTFEGAASRPRLQIAVYGAAGATLAGDPVIVSGVQTQQWLLGPLAIGGDGAAALRIDGEDTELILMGALTLRLAR
jgi:hypothetical protein